VQCELRPLQPRASPVWIVRAVVVESALRRLYPVSCALQIGNSVLPRLQPRAFPARSLRRHPCENGRLELLRGRHWATPIFPRLGDRASLAEPPQHCKRDYDRATADYSEAIRLDPKYAFALNNRGLAYGDKRDYDGAVSDFSETIRLDPKLAIAFYGRANTYREKGDRDRAIEDFREARAGTE
jgi:tetratricopeptide (TPR) repeat protein